MSKAYGQYCGLARALDRVGERWTLLIVRELLLGPRRFSDLRAALPGIPSNLLSDRLRRLAADGIVERRRLHAPAGTAVYELTELGRGLEPAIHALVRWGGAWMADRGDDHFDARWLVVALQSLLAGRAAPADVTAELRADGAVVTLRAHEGCVDVTGGECEDADVVAETDGPTLLAIAAGRTSLARARVSGSREACAALERLLS